MARKKASAEGLGPKLLGRGVDLLFESGGDQAPESQEPALDASIPLEAHELPPPLDADTRAGLAAEAEWAVADAELTELPSLDPPSRSPNGRPQLALEGHGGVEGYLRAAALSLLQAGLALPEPTEARAEVATRSLRSVEPPAIGNDQTSDPLVQLDSGLPLMGDGLAAPVPVETPPPLNGTQVHEPSTPNGRRPDLMAELEWGLPMVHDRLVEDQPFLEMLPPLNGYGLLVDPPAAQNGQDHLLPAEMDDGLPPLDGPVAGQEPSLHPIDASPVPGTVDNPPVGTGPSGEAETPSPSLDPGPIPSHPAAGMEPTAGLLDVTENDMPEEASQPRPQAPPDDGNAAPPATRRVGPPGVTVTGPALEMAGLPNGQSGEDLPPVVSGELEQMEQGDVEEIMGRLDARDLRKLDREIDRLYDQVAEQLSGKRYEAQAAFQGLRDARQILLLQPEHFAEAEYRVQQIRALIFRIERSAQTGSRYGLRLFGYQVVWLAFLAVVAWLTTIPDNPIARWVELWFGSSSDGSGFAWSMLLLSTLAWGGIGGVTGGLWSLHYHISVARDYEPADNMWYLEQPVLGMVLGGIVYLIMASGFLIVQADLSGADAALGAKLLPAAVAVVAGFRQTVVLDLIERVVQLLAPKGEDDRPQRPTI